MTKSRARLTELEGAMLGVIRLDPSCTAYRVRRVFLASRSAEWSGSAGAVYPAIRRLQAEGLLKERTENDGRGTHTYRLTPSGEAAHVQWLCDGDRASGPGLDPFRTRAGFWSLLSPKKRIALLTRLRRQIEQRRNDLRRELPSLDANDAIMTNLDIALQDLRLKWIAANLNRQTVARS
jgi:DNA-binding PadR family transcriptional regulator